MIIPMSSPDISDAEIDEVKGVLRTPFLSFGPKIKAFENNLASLVGTRHAVAVNSGTSGLHLCIIAAGVQENDLVITTPFSFVASANVTLYERAIPVFIDVDQKTGNLDTNLVLQAVQDLQSRENKVDGWLPPNLRGEQNKGALKAILPVHVFGQPADMDPISKIAQKYNLTVVEDACEALGSEYKERKAGSLGKYGVFAFYPNKQITTGEGGMIVTDCDDSANLFRSLRNQGRDIFNEWLEHSKLGYNYRMDEMSAALGLAQLRRIEELIEKRSKVAGWYNERLEDIELVEIPQIVESTTRMSWFVYVIRLKEPVKRNQVMKDLAAKGIPSRPYFSPIHLQPFYREKFGYNPGDFPVAEYLGKVSLALPFSSVMTEEQVDLVCDTLKKVLKKT